MEHIIPAEFHGTSLSIIDRDGQKWLTAEEAGHCLGYDESNARKGVVKLFERHGDEFSESDSRVVNLTSRDGKPRPTRIFSATGCIKLGFFANTPRAKDFRAWASKVLSGQHTPALRNPSDLALATEVGKLRDLIAQQGQMIVGLYERMDAARVGHIRAQAATCRILDQQRRLLATQEKANARERILQMEADGIPRDVIAMSTGRTSNHIRQVIWQAKQSGTFPMPSTQRSAA